MKLSHVKTNQKVKIRNIPAELKKRLLAFGLMEGDEVTVISKSLLGGGVTVGIRGNFFGIRNTQAKLIGVEV